MKFRRTILKGIVSAFFFIVLAIFFFKSDNPAQTKQLDLSCPPPTVQKGNQCVLEEDITLSAPLVLDSNTKLNCQGHTITPNHPGAGIPNNVNPRSEPEVAIFLDEASGVKIQNCIINYFDFGILAINSKNPVEHNKILRNTITARFAPITLISVDYTEIKENTLTVTTIGGIGLYVGRNSDNNDVKNNIITADLSGTPGAVRVPGPSTTAPADCPFPAATHCSSNPILNNSFAVSINQTFAGEPTLLNMILEGALYQLIISDNPEPDEDFTEDNTFEGNSVSFPQVRAVGLFLSISQGTKALKNKISNATVGMQVAGIFGDGTVIQGKRQFPGTCTGDPNRLCLSDGDCNIPVLNEENKGTCVLPPIQNVNWRARDVMIENNTIINPSMVGIVSVGENLNFKGNKITGAPTATAIQVAGPYALETSIITQNIVSSVAQALNFGQVFQGTFPSFFGAKFSLNDFTDYSTAVSLQGSCALDSRLFCVNNAQCVVQGVNFGPCTPAYTLPTELSVDDQGNVCGPGSTGCQGNNWGLTCEAGGFDPNKVRNFNGTVNSNVVDSHPYDVNEPVGVIVTDKGPCDSVSKTCSGDSAISCFTDANCIDYTERPEPPPPLICPEQGF